MKFKVISSKFGTAFLIKHVMLSNNWGREPRLFVRKEAMQLSMNLVSNQPNNKEKP